MANKENKTADFLDKTDEGDYIPKMKESKEYIATKKFIVDLCKYLSKPSKEVYPDEVAKMLENYINSEERLQRILYSEISNYLFNLQSPERDSFISNVNDLHIYSLSINSSTDRHNVDNEDVRKMVIKIFDHTQLVYYQIESFKKIFDQSISEEKEALHKQLKEIEKEYITILGIFASIIIAFVGSLTFNTSVLSNLPNSNPVHLIMVSSVIGLVFYNLIAYLIAFLREINEKEVHWPVTIRYILINAILIILIFWSFCMFKKNNINIDNASEASQNGNTIVISDKSEHSAD